MTDVVLKSRLDKRPMQEPTAWDRLKVNKNWLGVWFMLPAAAFLILFLAYPLGLGVWLSFTDARISRSGVFVGLENYEWSDGTIRRSSLFGVQHTALHDRRQRHKIRGRRFISRCC